MEDQFYQELTRILPQNQIKQKERMENHTSLHIGGEADYFVTPTSANEIKAVICLCNQEKIPCYIMGNGSNLLVSDEGFRGLVLKLGEDFSYVTVMEDGTVTAQAGILLSKLANEVARNSFTGFEFAAGIPGTLGGAVTMNAGAYDGDIKQCIMSAKLMDTEGNIHCFNKEELELGYRRSILQKNNYILLEAEMKFQKGDMQEILNKINELNTRRRDKQPLDQYSAGSTFRRPEGYYTGKLVNDAGLRGYQVGGAAVSEKHCGFIINKGNATAKDFLTVIQDVVRIVNEKFGVRLEPEVKYLGEFNQPSSTRLSGGFDQSESPEVIMRFVIVTGMSGAGKSSALKMLEDAGYFCVDNLPIQLVKKFVKLVAQGNQKMVALGLDVRSGQALKEMESLLLDMKRMDFPYEILYLDCITDVLVKRYKETRRNHPLSEVGRVDKGIEQEREQLEFLRRSANVIIDTSHLLIRELKTQINKIYLNDEKFNNFFITILSFGFKYGIPVDSDLVFDVRFLPNPYYIEKLKKKTGNDAEVNRFVMESETAVVFLNKLSDLLTFLIPNYILEGKNQLVVSIGCTGGKHRSVTLVNELAKRLNNTEYGIKVEHRDIEKDE